MTWLNARQQIWHNFVQTAKTQIPADLWSFGLVSSCRHKTLRQLVQWESDKLSSGSVEWGLQEKRQKHFSHLRCLYVKRNSGHDINNNDAAKL